ncbi:ATP-binding SpoIIE family protein phosphatase [Streptomyces sp. NBC_01262]|uniref:ATP-binding SpoIIE family protein phosphatase n=1 Tax=Streptomyces sp. NBC_01262 TaxID=2903803 RepID=UPI002E36C1A9|nr:ATP-binding SpoIIE family protein phosphatase [Streptomyces sp. NBC_01262]
MSTERTTQQAAAASATAAGAARPVPAPPVAPVAPVAEAAVPDPRSGFAAGTAATAGTKRKSGRDRNRGQDRSQERGQGRDRDRKAAARVAAASADSLPGTPPNGRDRATGHPLAEDESSGAQALKALGAQVSGSVGGGGAVVGGMGGRKGRGLPNPAAAPALSESERLRYVGAATRRIARGIDLDEILLGLCRSVVPAFADAILVYLRDPLPVGDERPSGAFVLRLRRTDRAPDESASEHPETGALLPVVPSTEGAYGAAADHIDVPMDGALAEVLRGVRPLFSEAPQATAALYELVGGCPDPTSPAANGLILPTGRRAILAPLRGRRRVIGAAVLLRRPERPAFESEDLLVAAQLATHTALGVDKAAMYDREASTADSLQRAMLPDSLPQPTGVRLASRYLPAAESARVGGDWYDAIPLPGSRVALVVGDVMGHSMTSAAIMGQLRTTVQTLAGLDLAPQEVLYHLDEQAQRLGQDRMATCIYAVYDPIAHRVTIANAGHPPPVLLHANGLAEVLRVPPGAPIGVGGVPFEAVELPAPAGATLLLYTDGLVESRTRDVWGGIEMLRERLHAASQIVSPPPLEPLCDEVLDILGPGDRDDDIALLAARFDGIAPRDVAYWFLEPRAQTAGRARRLVRQALRRWDLEPLTEATELLVSEIVTNAVRYAERPITLRLLRTDVLRCEVGDDAPTLPRMRHAQPQDEGGRGLYLVSRMAQRWGATRLSTGKVVWFEMGIPGGLHR